jgi:hypothetical protein
MKTHPHLAWSRLTAAARRAPKAASAAAISEAAPLGFAARVVALAELAIFERLAARALGFAGACAFAMLVWTSLPSVAAARANDSASDTELDPVGAVLEAVQS